jgi:hypothetical protein
MIASSKKSLSHLHVEEKYIIFSCEKCTCFYVVAGSILPV